jgi:tRNA A37 methylthiotransferase MiaB
MELLLRSLFNSRRPITLLIHRFLYKQYNLAEFRKVVEYLNTNVRGMTVATDFICGFPTETPEDFEISLVG